jgi:hypothetical protein
MILLSGQLSEFIIGMATPLAGCELVKIVQSRLATERDVRQAIRSEQFTDHFPHCFARYLLVVECSRS